MGDIEKREKLADDRKKAESWRLLKPDSTSNREKRVISILQIWSKKSGAMEPGKS